MRVRPRVMPSPVHENDAENEEGNVKIKQEELDEQVSAAEDGGEKEQDEAGEDPAETKKYENWPMKDISEYHDHDVLYGRGGGTNHHPGNKRYRKMVEDRKMDYVNSKRLDKPLVALEIIRTWRGQNPPGRFLKLDESTGLWQDVGDRKAREKTSQALREKAPLLRKQQDEEDSGDDSDEDAATSTMTKTTRFAAGTHAARKDPVKKAMLARDHSLGRDYFEQDEEVTLDGFSWSQPLEEVYLDGRTASGASLPPPPPPPHDHQPPHYAYPPGRINSQGSVGVPHPNYHQSHGSYGPPPRGADYGPPPRGADYGPPPPGADYRVISEDSRHARYSSQGRYESWGQPISSMGSALGTMPPPPPPPYGGQYPPSRSGSWGPPSGSWGPLPPGRDHSLSYNPLRDATISQPGTGFDSRSGSGYWSSEPMPPAPPPHAGGQYARGHPEPYRAAQQQAPSNHSPPQPPPPGATAPSPYDVDPVIAQTWSSQSDEQTCGLHGRQTIEVPEPPRRTWSGEEHDRMHAYYRSPPVSPSKRHGDEEQRNGALVRPPIVKRATSNQNEDRETRRDLHGASIKRAALNRDNSAVANRLKEECGMQKKERFDTDKEMHHLSGTLEQAKLDATGSAPTTTRPKRVSGQDRKSTIDKIAMDLMTQPEPAGLERNRSSTIDALLDYDSDAVLRADFDRMISTEDSLSRDFLPRPESLAASMRLTTVDFMELVNEPLLEKDLGMPSRPDLNRDVSVSDWLNDF